jgi:hypothetical protein
MIIEEDRARLESTDCASLIGSMKGAISVKNDILSTGIRWRREP